MQYLRVKNWEHFQHYKDRLPPWIKLHRELLTDYEFCALADESKAHLMLIWMLASQMDGRIPNDAKFIGQRIGAINPVNIKVLVSGGWLVVEGAASKPLANRKQSAIVETETYKATEAETEKPGEQEAPLADWVPKSAWADFVVFRKQQKGWTTKAGSLLLRELEKLYRLGHDPTLVLEQSIANGWKGLFALRQSGREPTLAERRAANIAELTGQKHGRERVVVGIAERVDRPAIPALPDDLRQSDGTDVGRCASGRD